VRLCLKVMKFQYSKHFRLHLNHVVLHISCQYTEAIRSPTDGPPHHMSHTMLHSSRVLPCICLQFSSYPVTGILVMITFASDESFGLLTYSRGNWRDDGEGFQTHYLWGFFA
jgi:hypothetical protein